MSLPRNEQELFEAYIQDECSTIFDGFGSLTHDELREWARKYAQEHNLIFKEEWIIGL